MIRLLTIIVVLLFFSLPIQAAKIVVEGEGYTSISPSMIKTISTQASNGAYVEIPLRRPHATTETGPSDTGNCIYKINITQAGNYYFWARTNWYDSCGNSFFVILDNKPAVVIGEDGTYSVWHWVKGPIFNLTTGTHTLRIQNREDGAKLDQFMLIDIARYVPVRVEQKTQ